MIGIFANSAVWIRIGPMTIQRGTPSAVPTPVPITSVKASSTTASAYNGGAIRSNHVTGKRSTNGIAIKPRTNQRSCMRQRPATSVNGTSITPAL